MAKLFKWLMVLFIPLFSLTLTSCGGDDEDEPDNPGTETVSSSFLIGRWVRSIYDGSKEESIEFYKDGSYESITWTLTYTPTKPYAELLTRGTWRLENQTLVLNGNRYHDREYDDEYTAKFKCSFDEYSQKLILRYIESNYPDDLRGGNFSKSY